MRLVYLLSLCPDRTRETEMHKQTQPISCSLPPSNQDSDKPSMACQQVGADEPTSRSTGGAHDAVRPDRGAEDQHVVPSSMPADDFEFCILSSGGLALAGDNAAADMCVADEVFSGGKLLPLRLSSAASADASSAALLLLRSDSLDGTATSTTSSGGGFSSRSVSRSNSCVSRSTSSNSASSNHAVPVSSSSIKSASSTGAAIPPRRSLSGNVFYAHPSPSPRPLPRRSRIAAPAAARHMSTGSVPPASWGIIRLGVVGAPEVYTPRPAEYRKVVLGERKLVAGALHQQEAVWRLFLRKKEKLAAGRELVGQGASQTRTAESGQNRTRRGADRIWWQK